MKFWNHANLLNHLLFPLSFLYLLGHIIKFRLSKPQKVNAYIICIGNLTVGGSGKTPLAIALGKSLQSSKKIAFILRGYKGKLSCAKPIRVSNYHTVQEVGDEAILLSKVAPTYICANRYLSAQQASQDGAEVIIMDDGLQNNTLHKDMAILVIDGNTGQGNGMLLPAGPLREPLDFALSRCSMVFFYNKTLAINFPHVFKGKLEPTKKNFPRKKYAAMCGIGNPSKFYNTLKETGITVVKKFTFADHHNFSTQELSNMIGYAQQHKVKILTTSKDFVRLPKNLPADVFEVFEVEAKIPLELIKRIEKSIKQ